jgi:hypothetical protein
MRNELNKPRLVYAEPGAHHFAAFVRNRTPEQQSALAGIMELVDKEEEFRSF